MMTLQQSASLILMKAKGKVSRLLKANVHFFILMKGITTNVSKTEDEAIYNNSIL